MATTARDGANGKEKRGTPTSDPQLKKSLKSTSPSSLPGRTSYLTSSEKSVPNYLKPTLSSRRDVSTPSKRSSMDTSAQKSSLDRRRSFDRPPSTIHLHREPQPTVAVNSQEKTSRSMSFTDSTRNSPSSSRPITERSCTMAIKDAKTESPFARAKSMKKVMAPTKKEHLGSPLKKKAPKSVTSESLVETHNKESGLNQVVMASSLADHEIESLPGISEMPGNEQQLGDPPVDELKNVKQVEAEAQGQNAGEVHQLQQGHNCDDSNVNFTSKYTEDTAGELAENDVKVVVNDDNKLEGSIPDADRREEEVIKEELTDEEKYVKAWGEEADNGGEKEEAKVMETEAENTSSIVKQQLFGPGGKKESQVYNAVIEETASKLMENRKNKVRALAGAFETVISLQETK